MHTYIHTYIHTYSRMSRDDENRCFIHTYIHSYIRKYIIPDTYIFYMHTVHTYLYLNRYFHTYIHTYKHTYILTYIHTYIHGPQIKHCRLAMLAAAGWPLSELWHKEIADFLGLDSILAAEGKVGGAMYTCIYICMLGNYKVHSLFYVLYAMYVCMGSNSL